MIRLFVDQELSAAARVVVEGAQCHYLRNVMRRSPGDEIALFNGRDGEWRARIATIDRKACELAVAARLRSQTAVPDIWLLFAPVKSARLDFIAQKATELGVSALHPVLTQRTVVRRLKTDRIRANAVEAAEQCGRLSVPTVAEPVPLDAVLRSWPSDRRLIVCDQGGAPPARLQTAGSGPWAILIGPEGGFSPEERDHLGRLDLVTRIGLGPRILRTDTAVVAALSLWQAMLGDWQA